MPCRSKYTIGPFIFDCAYQKPKVVYWQWIVVVVLTILIIIVLIFPRVRGLEKKGEWQKWIGKTMITFHTMHYHVVQSKGEVEEYMIKSFKMKHLPPSFLSTNTDARASQTNTQLNNYSVDPRNCHSFTTKTFLSISALFSILINQICNRFSWNSSESILLFFDPPMNRNWICVKYQNKKFPSLTLLER